MDLRHSKIKSVILYSIVIAVLFPYSVIIGADIVFRFEFADFEADNWFVIMQVSMGTCFLLFSCLAYAGIRIARLKQKIWFVWCFVGLLLIGLVFMLSDEPAFKNPYTWKDVPKTLPGNQESYNLLVDQLVRPDPENTIVRSEMDIREVMADPLAFENEILEKWGKIEKARKLIDALDTFDQIADLSTPEGTLELKMIEVVFLARYYRAYALLMAEKGRWDEAVAQLGRMHSVTRKALPYARYVIHKSIWTAVAKHNIITAHQLAIHPRADKNALQQLQLWFPPLDMDQVSFRGALISETMLLRRAAKSVKPPGDQVAEVCGSFWYNELCDSRWNRAVLHLLAVLSNKPETTGNYVYQNINIMIEACSQHPPDISRARVESAELKLPLFGNTIGMLLTQPPLTYLTNPPERLATTKVLSDLLAMYLQARTGDGEPLKDYLCGTEYLQTGNAGAFKSPGWDCATETGDDIAFEK